jgi:hypothetical protein
VHDLSVALRTAGLELGEADVAGLLAGLDLAHHGTVGGWAGGPGGWGGPWKGMVGREGGGPPGAPAVWLARLPAMRVGRSSM